MNAGRLVREDEISAGGWHFLNTDVWFWHDGFKNLRHYIPFGQNDWAKIDTSGSSTLDNVYDSGTGRVSARITPNVFGIHYLYKRIIVPRDFGIFAPTTPISIVTRRSAADTAFTISLYNGSTVDPGVNGVSIDPAVANTWELFSLTPTGTYNAGDLITVQIQYVAAANARTIEVADLQMSYKTNNGNV